MAYLWFHFQNCVNKHHPYTGTYIIEIPTQNYLVVEQAWKVNCKEEEKKKLKGRAVVDFKVGVGGFNVM